MARLDRRFCIPRVYIRETANSHRWSCGIDFRWQANFTSLACHVGFISANQHEQTGAVRAHPQPKLGLAAAQTTSLRALAGNIGFVLSRGHDKHLISKAKANAHWLNHWAGLELRPFSSQIWPSKAKGLSQGAFVFPRERPLGGWCRLRDSNT